MRPPEEEDVEPRPPEEVELEPEEPVLPNHVSHCPPPVACRLLREGEWEEWTSDVPPVDDPPELPFPPLAPPPLRLKRSDQEADGFWSSWAFCAGAENVVSSAASGIATAEAVSRRARPVRTSVHFMLHARL